MDFLFEGIMAVTWKQIVMYVIGILLIWLAVRKSMNRRCCFPWDLRRFCEIFR